MMGRVAHATNIFGMYYNDTYMNKSVRRELKETGHDWVMRTLNNHKVCYKIFRMTRPIFNCLHETLVDNYELKSTMGMNSIESLAMFLWIVGGPQSVSQVENKFQRSIEIIVRKFDHVLDCLNRLRANNIKSKDP
jgi:phosphotransferase system IIB component